MNSRRLIITLACLFTVALSPLRSGKPNAGGCCSNVAKPESLAAGCSAGTRDEGGGCGGACGLDLKVADDAVSLSPEARERLVLQWAEENLAATVYRTLGETYRARPFQNIPRAEDRHAQAMRDLLQAADINLEEIVPHPDLATLQSDLIARGQQSEVEALKVGAFIEERDIADLRELAELIEDVTARRVIQQLEAGSQHHLKAFVRNLQRRGASYEPVVLSATEFAAISN